jgi:hypothetical protein
MARDDKGRGSNPIGDKPREYVVRLTEDEKALIEQIRRDSAQNKPSKQSNN